MSGVVGEELQISPASDGKAPRTARGERTLRRILDSALEEFGERGFHEASIVGITKRAQVALGTFYTYFDSKEEVFRALVGDMSARVRDHVTPSLVGSADAPDLEQRALASFLQFAAEHRHVYRIIDEAEFVDPAAFREHYETTASRISTRLSKARGRGELDDRFAAEDLDVIAWALMGANVFLGLRYAVWQGAEPAWVAGVVEKLVRHGLAPRGDGS